MNPTPSFGILLINFRGFESGYKALINSLVRRAQQGAGVGGQGGNTSLTEAVGVLSKMSRELPDSTFAQITSATVYARSGRLEESETMLRGILEKDSSNMDALVALAEVRQILGHPAEAAGMLEDSLKVHPKSPSPPPWLSCITIRTKPPMPTPWLRGW